MLYLSTYIQQTAQQVGEKQIIIFTCLRVEQIKRQPYKKNLDSKKKELQNCSFLSTDKYFMIKINDLHFVKTVLINSKKVEYFFIF